MQNDTYVTGECPECGAEIRVSVNTSTIFCLKCMKWTKLTIEKIMPEGEKAK